MTESLPPHIAVALDRPPPDWDPYVGSHPGASAYHLTRWVSALAAAFRLPAYFLSARDAEDRLTGVLPLIRQKSWLFGDRLVSLPYVNYGGALADSDDTRIALLTEARRLRLSLGAQRLELRERAAPPRDWTGRKDKAALVLELPPTQDALQKTLGSKLRSQIKRAEREPLETKVGGRDRVDDFYAAFASVMRDHGTPVYPRAFFESLMEHVSDDCTIVTLHSNGRPVAGAFLVSHGGESIEVPWAATIAAMKPKSTNMALYSALLRLAVERGFRRFDFGRSTIDSGPYRFKLQWGAVPVPLYWNTDVVDGRAPGDDTSAAPSGSRRNEVLTRLWSKLPLAVANRLGPMISPSLPW